MSKHRTIFGLTKHTQICLNRMIGVTHIIMDNRNSRTGRESVGIQKESRQLTEDKPLQVYTQNKITGTDQGDKPFKVYTQIKITGTDQGDKPFKVYTQIKGDLDTRKSGDQVVQKSGDRTGATVSTSNDISFSILQAKDIVFQRRAYVNSTL